MKKIKWDKEVIIIAGFIFFLCLITFFRVSSYYDHFLEGTKLQSPRYR
jgi:hypothetical protein